MKGVKINNYIDNRIVVSDRKLKKEMQTLIQSSRPRPLVIRHLNYIDAEEEEHQIENASISHDKNKNADSKIVKKKKKGKTSCFSGNDQQQQEVLHREKSKSRINKSSTKRILAIKKESRSSSPKYREDGSLDETQTRFRSGSKNGEALGKRSESAIIKRNKSPSQILLDNQLKNNEDQSLKIKINKKKEDPDKKKKPKPSKKNEEIPKSKLNKNDSYINIRDKKNKNEKESGSRTSRVNSKSNLTSSKQPKNLSARENKKKDVESNQLEKTMRTLKKEYISLEELLCTTREDPKFKNAVSKLEEVINSKGSRKPIEKIELLVKKLQEIEDEEVKLIEYESKREVKIEMSPKNESEEEDEDEQEDLADEQLPLQDENFLNNAFTNTKIVRDLLESENIKEKQAESNKTTNIQVKANQYKIEYENVRQLLEHENGLYEGQNAENPLIGLKNGGDSYFELADYDSINSVKSNIEENKQMEISEFKKFQEQSDMMMKKIKQIEEKKKLKEKIETEQNSEIIHTTPEIVKNHSSPRNIEINNYAFEKYPIPDAFKSPKFNADGIIEVIKLREKVFADRHEKLSELVNVLYTKQVVSPKTYNLQLNSLKQNKEQNSSTIDEYKKHAEELSQLLEEIKKEREEITSIDEIIRKENWDNAIDLIKTKEEEGDKRPSLKRQEILPERINSQESSSSAAVFYYDDDEEISDTGFKLVQVEELSEEALNLGIEDNFKSMRDDPIKNEEEPKRRGFESNLFFIKEYCIALCEFTRDKHKQTFKQRIAQPMSYNLQKLLQDFRTTTDNQPAIFFDSLFEDLRYHDADFHNNVTPISLEIFNEFNKQYNGIKYYGKEESEDATLEGIFLTSIFNALNESICIEKPASIHGEPLPWAQAGKHLKNLRNSDNKSRKIKQNEDNQDSEDLIFGTSIARIIQWGSCLCGFIPDTAELENTEIDEEYITHIRETRTALLLEKMLNDEESLMHRDELEITEVELSIARMVYEGIVDEMVTEINQLQRKGIVRTVDY